MMIMRLIPAVFIFFVISASGYCQGLESGISSQSILADMNKELLHAAYEGNADRVRYLLEAGADVNYTNLDGKDFDMTALLYAAGRGHTEVVKLLIDSGADLNVKDAGGATAMELAEASGFTDIVRLIKAAVGSGLGDTSKAETVEALLLKISASSVLPPSSGYRYDPEMAFDGDPKTVWCEGEAGSGTGSIIMVSLDREISVDAIEVMGGFFDSRYFLSNNRVQQLRVETKRIYSNFSLKDVMEAQRFHFDRSTSFNQITFTILSVYRGEKWDDTCISEIAFYQDGSRIPLRLPSVK